MHFTADLRTYISYNVIIDLGYNFQFLDIDCQIVLREVPNLSIFIL